MPFILSLRFSCHLIIFQYNCQRLFASWKFILVSSCNVSHILKRNIWLSKFLTQKYLDFLFNFFDRSLFIFHVSQRQAAQDRYNQILLYFLNQNVVTMLLKDQMLHQEKIPQILKHFIISVFVCLILCIFLCILKNIAITCVC